MQVLQWMLKPTTIMGPICKYYNECKKPTTIMGPICEYYNECKNQQPLWDLYAGIEMNVKNQQLLWDFYVGITMNIKKNVYYGTYMWVLHIWKWPYGIYNRKWCRYYMFKMCVLF